MQNLYQARSRDLTPNKILSDWMMIAVLSIHFRSRQAHPSMNYLSSSSQAHTQATVSLVKRFGNEDWPPPLVTNCLRVLVDNGILHKERTRLRTSLLFWARILAMW